MHHSFEYLLCDRHCLSPKCLSWITCLKKQLPPCLLTHKVLAQGCLPLSHHLLKFSSLLYYLKSLLS